MHCGSTDVIKGDIFEWVKITKPKKRIFKNLVEYEEYKARVTKQRNYLAKRQSEAISKEIKEELESLYV